MRRVVAVLVEEQGGAEDERAMQFDVRRLEPGDHVEVFIEPERRWVRGRFRISTAGDALVELPCRQEMTFERALASGLRRVLH